MIQTLEWTASGVRFIDQTKLPNEEVYVTCTTYQQVADVIRNMVVRGAPAIGCVAAYAVVLAARQKDLKKAYAGLLAARPTAVNLRWAIERMRQVAEVSQDLAHEAKAIEDEDRLANRQMGTFGDDKTDQTQYSVSDTLTWMHSGHGIRAGGGWAKHLFVENGNWLGAGQIRFSGSRPVHDVRRKRDDRVEQRVDLINSLKVRFDDFNR